MELKPRVPLSRDWQKYVCRCSVSQRHWARGRKRSSYPEHASQDASINLPEQSFPGLLVDFDGSLPSVRRSFCIDVAARLLLPTNLVMVCRGDGCLGLGFNVCHVCCFNASFGPSPQLKASDAIADEWDGVMRDREAVYPRRWQRPITYCASTPRQCQLTPATG